MYLEMYTFCAYCSCAPPGLIVFSCGNDVNQLVATKYSYMLEDTITGRKIGGKGRTENRQRYDVSKLITTRLTYL